MMQRATAFSINIATLLNFQKFAKMI